MKTIYVEKTKGAPHLIEYLHQVFPSAPISALYKALRNKDIKINGKRVHQIQPLLYQDKIEVYLTDDILFQLPKSIHYCYQDDNILIVEKPQGILTNHPNSQEPTLESLVQKEMPNVILCHRLDRNTGGLVIFAKTKLAYQEICKGFQQNAICKEYIAYVYNCHFEKNQDILQQYLKKDKESGYVTVASSKQPHTQLAITTYQVLQKRKKENYAILKLNIKTGKTHQIRVQLKSIGHPIIGDSKYGENEINKRFKQDKQLLFAVSYRFNFESNSPLCYLNKTIITLPKEKYNKLGCDIHEV